MQLGLGLNNHSFLPDQDFDWTYSVYANVHEILPDDMPEPLGKAVTPTTTMDANLNHCLATGKSWTEGLYFVNKTPVDWYSEKKPQWKQLLMVQSSLLPKQQQNRSWTLGRP